MSNETNDCIVVVNIRINGISRHKQQVYRAGASKAEIKAIKERLKAELHEQWDDVLVQCTTVNADIPDEFKRYHEQQEEEYGYRKYQIERENKYHGKITFSVHAMMKCGDYLKNKLDHVSIDEVRNFINNNPVVG